MNKYYKVRFPNNLNRYQWLMNCFYDPNSEFMLGAQKQAMIYSSNLFNQKNRLTDFLNKKEYELVEICDIEKENSSRIVDNLYW